jgi:hypothetical protein
MIVAIQIFKCFQDEWSGVKPQALGSPGESSHLHRSLTAFLWRPIAPQKKTQQQTYSLNSKHSTAPHEDSELVELWLWFI